MLRKIGLHVRMVTSFLDLLQHAQTLSMPIFQCFVITKQGRVINPSSEEVAQMQPYMNHFSERFLHASYWSNLASIKQRYHRVLMKELALARQLGFTHIIMHPGSAKGARERKEGIDALARTMNRLLKEEDTIKLVLENTAHQHMSIGGDLQDFYAVLQKINHPERVFFCIDTAHAYSFGYDLANPEKQDAFIAELQATVTLEKIVLIHLNDTYNTLGSNQDRHAVPGEGLIGEAMLKRFVLDPRLAHIPLLVEPPIISDEQQRALLKKIGEWCT